MNPFSFFSIPVSSIIRSGLSISSSLWLPFSYSIVESPVQALTVRGRGVNANANRGPSFSRSVQIIDLSKGLIRLERSVDGHRSLLEWHSSIPGPR